MVLGRFDLSFEQNFADAVKYFDEHGDLLISVEFIRKSRVKLFSHYAGQIKMYKPDIVLTYTIKSSIYGGLASRICKVPYISNITGLGSVAGRQGPLQSLVAFPYRIALKKASCVFFQNKENVSLEELLEKTELFLSLANGELREMGIKTRQKVEREFDRQIVVNAYLEEVERACLTTKN